MGNKRVCAYHDVLVVLAQLGLEPLGEELAAGEARRGELVERVAHQVAEGLVGLQHGSVSLLGEGKHGQRGHALAELVGRPDVLELDEGLHGDVVLLAKLLPLLELLDVVERAA